MVEVKADRSLVACCGLYCAACGSFLKGHCPGCKGNEKASWCRVRSCCIERGYGSCADCAEFPDPDACPKFNNFMARVIGFFLNSNRQACVLKIREIGPDGYASFMAERRLQKLPRRGTIPGKE